ncbi:TerB family tellurite resistance protein [Phaeobacter sp. PT47_59]|uniref:TerB family tellurite resistance protein n=1 Tax=Phaeobacter sp. PT47_59 TaxID=3029979 RepID=UPI00238038D3|nr:TerB family tellurite resistance protein [Phaeobacter sp. PT47_59]MDE4173578.1 TerB family tellurite resistance protein [Phaeobacter sp. PT47_59]
MSLWTRISEALGALAKGESLAHVFDKLKAPPERTVGFAIAVIALGAKMAKADGQVTRDEVTAFREVFQIARADEAGAARVFNMARTDVAGYQDYAARIQRMFANDPATLCDLMEGLFHIAMADGFYHPGENEFLEEVSRIFGQTPQQFTALRARFVTDAPKDPYAVLGVPADMPLVEIRKHWRRLVRETHPDAMMARGVPEEAVRLAEKRMIDINRAWDEINGCGTHAAGHL